MEYSRFLTDLSKRRKPDVTFEIVALKFLNPNPDRVHLDVGSPSNATLPYTEISVTINDGEVIKIKSKDLIDALQYGPSRGYPPLVEEIKQLIKKYHSPPCWDQTDIVITAGGLDGLTKAIEMILTPNDYFITQEPAYCAILNGLRAHNPNIIAVPCDQEGLDPKFLRNALSKWDPQDIKNENNGIPKMIYVNPNGGNPTGTSMSFGRKREIYRIASEYNLIILEDDPYFFLQFSEIQSYIPSFLSMDVDGRVIRFDSFSKLISPGMRLGFATGPKQLVEQILVQIQSTRLNTANLTQVILYKTLEYWGHAGFISHINFIRNTYINGKNCMENAAIKYLKENCEWTVPTCGIYFWIKVRGVSNTYDMIVKRGLKKGVLMLPGNIFMVNSDAQSQYLRASFAQASEKEIEKGFKILAELINEEIALHSEKKKSFRQNYFVTDFVKKWYGGAIKP